MHMYYTEYTVPCSINGEEMKTGGVWACAHCPEPSAGVQAYELHVGGQHVGVRASVHTVTG